MTPGEGGVDEEAGPLVQLLGHLQSAERIARDGLIRGHLGTSLHGEEGTTPGAIEVDRPHGPPDDTEPADGRVQEKPPEVARRARDPRRGGRDRRVSVRVASVGRL